MKNTWNMTVWALAVALIAALVLTNCGGGNDDNNGDDNDRPPYLTNGNFGETLTISGEQVYNTTYGDGWIFTPYSGEDLTVFLLYYDFVGEIVALWEIGSEEVGTISESGKLNLSISGEHCDLSTINSNTIDWFRFRSQNFSISNPDAQYYYLDLINRTAGGLRKVKVSELIVGSVEERNEEFISYIYFDRDVRITHQETSYIPNIDLQFKKGWNAFYERYFETSNRITNIHTYKESFYVGDFSDVKWALGYK
jgi:hypothetical protein